MNFIFALIASIIVSLISLIGIFALLISDNLLRKAIIFLIAFAAGGLIGGAFFDLIPEAAENIKDITELFVYVIIGYLLCFMSWSIYPTLLSIFRKSIGY